MVITVIPIALLIAIMVMLKSTINLYVAYLVMSLVTFGFYAIDKKAAIEGKWRIQELSLHLLSVFCGWPGALMAQKVLHHKSSKHSFQIGFWFTVILNIFVLIEFHEPLQQLVSSWSNLFSLLH